MACDNISTDNRESCVELTPSSCVPHTGYIIPLIKDLIPCRPNINDVSEQIQKLIEKIKVSLGDNTKLDKKCLTFDATIVTQESLNQLFITELCNIKQTLNDLDLTVNPELLEIAINLLCLVAPPCDVQTTYTLQEILEKLVNAYCDLLTRVKNIETILNI